MRGINCPVRGDAQKALVWLDEVTTSTASKSSGRVQLQGPDDQYTTWQEVERYLLPDTPFSRANVNGTDRVDALSKMLDRNLNTNSSQTSSPNTQTTHRSPSASPTSSASSLSSTAADTPVKADESSTALSAHGIPPSVRPLLNFVVWRTHHEDAIGIESGKYILVTNDPIIQKQASKFGVRAKLLAQLENILGKEGVKRVDEGLQAPTMKNFSSHSAEEDISDDEDRVVFDPSKRPTSSRGISGQTVPAISNVIDPDHFGRSEKVPIAKPATPKSIPNTTTIPRDGRGNFANKRGFPAHQHQNQHLGRMNAPNGLHIVGRGATGNPARGAGFHPRGAGYAQSSIRGAVHHTPGRGVPNGAPVGPRGSNTTFRGRGAQSLPFVPRGNSAYSSHNQFIPKPIDPDSFARPSPFGRGRGRGAAMYRLWEPANNG